MARCEHVYDLALPLGKGARWDVRREFVGSHD